MAFDEAYFNNIADQLDRIDICADLQSVLNRAFVDIQKEIDSLAEQAGILVPIAELVALAITDLPSVITFLEKLVTLVLTPYLAPYIKMVEQLAATVAAMERVVVSAEAAAGRITSCSLDIPTLDVPILPPIS